MIDVSDYINFVHQIACRSHKDLFQYMDYEDVVAAGMVGLLAASRAFEPERGIQFTTFAHPRISGAIIDEFRVAAPFPRGVYRRGGEYRRARAFVEARFAFKPTHRMMAAFLEVPEERVRLLEEQEAMMHFGRNAFPPESSLVPPVQPLLEDAALRSWIRRAVDRLNGQQRYVIVEYYWNDQRLWEIGDALQLTESRVSQIHRHALTSLRAMMVEEGAF